MNSVAESMQSRIDPHVWRIAAVIVSTSFWLIGAAMVFRGFGGSGCRSCRR